MISSIQLENFKAFGKRIIIPFSPITMIFGENSSGKSSILQSLNLLKQTFAGQDPTAVLLPRAEQGIVDLGAFQDLLFDHDLERRLHIRLEVDLQRRFLSRTDKFFPSLQIRSAAIEYTFARPSPLSEIQLQAIEVFLGTSHDSFAKYVPAEPTAELKRRASFAPFRDRTLKPSAVRAAKCVEVTLNPAYWRESYNWIKKNRPQICKGLERRLSDGEKSHKGSEPTWLYLDDDISHDTRPKSEKTRYQTALKFYSSDFTLKAFVDRMRRVQVGMPVALHGLVPSAVVQFGGDPVVREALRQTSQFWPALDLMDVGQVAEMAGRSVQGTLEQLFPMGPSRKRPERWYLFSGTSPADVGYQGDTLPHMLLRDRSLTREANKWLKRLGIGYRLKVRPISKRTRDLFEVKLQDTHRRKNITVGLPDVGYGISQLLPFIVQSLTKGHEIISIEQPEVHVHPRLQADIGDLLAAVTQKGGTKQFLVETHSEHLILRLQRLVRRGMLTPDHISVIHVSRGAEGAEVHRLRLDESGRFLDEWPGGFFPERLEEFR